MASDVTRRQFLKKSGRTALGVGLGTTAAHVLTGVSKATAQELPPSEKIIVGGIGCGGRGRGLLGEFQREPEVEIAAVCDVYGPNLDRAVGLTGGKAEGYRDFRELLDRPDLDVVVVATPDHWHCLPTIFACQSGKDVYVEKPLALSIGEGRAMVNAARKYDRVVQVGTQQRGGSHFRRCVEIVQSGALGTISLVRTWHVGNSAPGGMGHPEPTDPPRDLDWDMWLGPAPRRPFHPQRCLRHFRWFWDYSGGQTTDIGTHILDIMLWGMQVESPLAVSASGGKLAVDDFTETPDTLLATYEFPGFIGTYEYHGANAHPIDGRGRATQFHGVNGTAVVNLGGYEVIPEGGRMEPEKGPAGSISGAHVRNFLDCVKSRQRPWADVEVGHRSTILPHLANISLWTGHKIVWDASRERCLKDPQANQYLLRPYRKPWKIPKSLLWHTPGKIPPGSASARES